MQSPAAGMVPWMPSDVRIIDAPDTANAAWDLIAGYARRVDGQVQVRLDLLDADILPSYDLYLAIDDSPGGKSTLPGGAPTEFAWDKLIYLPANGSIQVTNHELEPIAAGNVLAIRNPGLDTVQIGVKTQGSGRISFQAFSAPAGDSAVADSTAAFSLEGQPPRRARTLLAFWNTLPAYSPAQALRRWDGAHTGPLGGRHGLGNLLKSARDYQAPVTLLDLKTISALSALDFLDQVQPLKEMADRGLLILPDVSLAPGAGPVADLPAELLHRAAATSRQVSLAIGLPASQFTYGALSGELASRYPFSFLPVRPLGQQESPGVSSAIYRYAGQLVLPIPAAITATQTTLDGPTLEIRRSLVQAALATNAGNFDEVTVLGGDLTRSTWGDPQHAAAMLRYLTAHPWIELLDAHDLLAAHPAQNLPVELSRDALTGIVSGLPDELQGSLEWAVQNTDTLAQNTWQAFLAGYAPVSPNPPELPALRRNYLGQVNTLAEARRWGQNPQPIARCDTDPDLDGQPECILASSSQFVAFEIDSGAMVYAFALRRGEAHQWIAPSSQFIVGLSDPASWELDKGLSADPSAIPGAFSDAGPFQASIQPGEVIFTSQKLVKSFTLLEDGIAIKYLSDGPQQVRIPLGVDPWMRFQADWEELYAADTGADSLVWGIPGDFQVEIISDAELSLQDFTASRRVVRESENPNIDYPAGHFGIFPLALVDVAAPAGFEMRFQFVP